MEVLLLDTTEEEGEDNLLYHYLYEKNESSKSSQWREIRGVLAAAMGAMRSVVSESLTTAHFKRLPSDTLNNKDTIIGYINLNEVLYVFILTECELPIRTVEYYTLSSCNLLVALFGYPGQKLQHWSQDVSTKLDSFFTGVHQTIQQDMAFSTHLQFALDGAIPSVSYSLEIMARLSAFELFDPVQLEPHETCIVGHAMFYRNMLVSSMSKVEITSLFAQWFLYGHDSYWACLDTHTVELDFNATVRIFSWFDPQHSLYGPYSDTHTLVTIQIEEMMHYYLVQHHQQSQIPTFRQEVVHCLSIGDVEEIAVFARQELAPHYVQQNQTLSTPLVYCLVVDKLRHTVVGSSPSQYETSLWMPVFLSYLHEFQCSEHTEWLFDTPLNPRDQWKPKVVFDSSSTSPSSLFLRACRIEDTGGDLSEASIFPPVTHQLRTQSKQLSRILDHQAVRIQMKETFYWIQVQYYQAYTMYSISDQSIPISKLEHEMDRLLFLQHV